MDQLSTLIDAERLADRAAAILARVERRMWCTGPSGVGSCIERELSTRSKTGRRVADQIRAENLCQGCRSLWHAEQLVACLRRHANGVASAFIPPPVSVVVVETPGAVVESAK